MRSGRLKIVLFLGVIAAAMGWLNSIPGVGMAGALFTVMARGILLGAADNLRYYSRPAQVLAIDRRCVTASSHINGFVDMPSDSCSPEDLASRLAAFNAPIAAPIRDANGRITEYPGKPQPEPGVALVSVRYTDKNEVSRTATLAYPTSDRGFYSTKVGDTISVMVCSNDPNVVKTSILFHPKC